MTTPFEQLSDMYWRGTKYPVSESEVYFRQGNIKHPVSFGAGELVQAAGSENLILAYTIPMREYLTDEGYPNLFTVGLPKLFRDCLNNTPGPLVDPIHGELPALPESYREPRDEQKKDGVDVHVEFVFAPSLEQLTALLAVRPSPLSLLTGTKALAAATLTVRTPTTEEAQAALADAQAAADLAQASAESIQVESSVGRFVAQIENVSAQLESYERSINEMQEPLTYPLVQESRRLCLAAYDLGRRFVPQSTGRNSATAQRRTRTVVVAQDSTTTALAKQHGMTLVDLIQRNPRLARSPRVVRGTQIVVVV